MAELTVAAQIRARDISLFDAIRSQTSPADRTSLLLLQDCVRECGPYVYLEIGSHLGGTIQPHYADPSCRLIYSIDKRPVSMPDERGANKIYRDNSTARMLANLKTAFPAVEDKIVTFDCDARAVDPRRIMHRPQICFIDGEHTNTAAYSDFRFCLTVSDDNAIIAFHDAYIVSKGIRKARRHLRSRSIPFQGFILAGDVYAILVNEAATRHAGALQSLAQDEAAYFQRGARTLLKMRLKNRLPRVYRALWWAAHRL